MHGWTKTYTAIAICPHTFWGTIYCIFKTESEQISLVDFVVFSLSLAEVDFATERGVEFSM